MSPVTERLEKWFDSVEIGGAKKRTALTASPVQACKISVPAGGGVA